MLGTKKTSWFPNIVVELFALLFYDVDVILCLLIAENSKSGADLVRIRSSTSSGARILGI